MPRRLTDADRLALKESVCHKCGERDRIGAERGFTGWLLKCLNCGNVKPLPPIVAVRRR